MQDTRSSHRSLFAADLLAPALRDAFKRLSPLAQLRNPVMFVVWVGSALTTVLGISQLGGHGPAGFTLAIIDTPGSDSHATRGAMRAADLCLVPVRPSEADLKATEPTIRALTALTRPFALVINQAPTSRQVRLTGAVNMRLRAFGDVAPTALAARIDHQYAYALGLGAMEFASKGKAATEVAELWSWCKKKMGGHAHGHQTKRRA